MSKRLIKSLLILLLVFQGLFVLVGSIALLRAEPPRPEDPNGPTVYITRAGRKYHRDGCRYLSKSEFPISLKDATAKGYTPLQYLSSAPVTPSRP